MTKRIIFTITALFSILVLSNTAIATPFKTTDPTPVVTEQSLQEALGLQSMDDLLTLTPKEIEAKTGRKLKLKEKLALRMLKKQVKKATKSPKKKRTRNKWLAAAFCFFLGYFAVHRFYLGRYWGAGGQLLLLITGLFILIPLIPLVLWVLVDLILILLGVMKPKDGKYA